MKRMDFPGAKNWVEEADLIRAALARPDMPPATRIDKHNLGFLVGNVPYLRGVVADDHGRLWAEDAHSLTLLFDPATLDDVARDAREEVLEDYRRAIDSYRA